MKSKESNKVKQRVFNASEGVRLHGRGFYALEKVKTRSKESFYTSEEGFYALEGVQMHRKRALTKFQVNLVIPKAIFMVIFQPKEGICI